MVGDSGEGAKYWPRWRGPSGQGVVSGTGYPDSWSGTENVKWKVPVPGSGNSSPIVWGDRIFVTTAYEGGRRLSVVAYRRTDGMKMWETFAPEGRTPYGNHYKNGFASATPATDGQRVYASFGPRGLMALDMNGKQVWHRDLGPMEAYHGTAGSPLLYKDRLILYQDQSRNSFISAFDTRTGKTLWSTPREANVGWGTPIAVRVVDHDEIIVNGQLRVLAYNPDTGAELWSCGGSTYEVIPTPVVGYGMVFCSSGRAGPTLAIRPGGKGDVTRSHSPGRARVDRRLCLHRFCMASTSTWSTTCRASSPASRRRAEIDVAEPARCRAPGRLLGVTGRRGWQNLLHQRRG